MAEAARELVVGTAGHVDHGKTALVEALTGTNTDRLEEERRRGISIELGFARLPLPSGRSLGVIDVPGHHRLVRTMVAGAGGIDLFLLAIDAAEGAMPQTREHVAVLRALGIERGVVALTKSDLAGAGAVEGARREAGELAPGAPAVAVSAVTGAGVSELLAALDSVAAGAAGSEPAGDAALVHLDRCFTLRGIGTVVAGTLRGGALAPGDVVELLPGRRRARIRALHVHDAPVERAVPGQRVAMALAGVGRGEVGRGDVLVAPGSGPAPTYRLDAELDFEPVGERRVHVHHGTRESPARLVELGDDIVQLRLSEPLMPLAGDRVVIRRASPSATLGGGVVTDPAPRRRGPGSSARAADPAEPAPAPAETPSARDRRPLTAASVRVLRELAGGGDAPPSAGAIGERLGMTRPGVERELAALASTGSVIRLGDGIAYPRDRLAALEARVEEHARARGSIGLAELRDELGVSRRHALALLSRLDSRGVTVRRGERRELRRPAGASD